MSPTADDVRRQLDRLLASTVFANAGRMSRFLKFVVEQNLAGEGERLKEYVIGIEVFDRDADYDPRVDSIVRVEATRLRSKLAEYYAGEGRSDRVILSLPKGGYAPIVKLDERPATVNGPSATNGSAAVNGAAVAASARDARPARRGWALGSLLVTGAAAAAFVAWAPTTPVTTLRIAVLPFDTGDTSAAALAQTLTEGVTAGLVQDGRFHVVASSAARAEYSATRRPRDIAAALDADVLIAARITTSGEHVRVEARAVGGALENKMWVEAFDGTVSSSDTLERAVAGGIAAAIGAGKISAAQ